MYGAATKRNQNADDWKKVIQNAKHDEREESVVEKHSVAVKNARCMRDKLLSLQTPEYSGEVHSKDSVWGGEGGGGGGRYVVAGRRQVAGE